MSNEVGFKANFIFLQPTDPSVVPNGSVFLDSTNGNSMSVKSSGGVTAPISTATGSELFIKQMQASGPIGLKKSVSKRPDGKVEQADSDAADGQKVVGYALQSASADGDLIDVFCLGANLAGALTGLGYTPGDEVYLSETGGYTNDPNSFTGGNDSIIRVGIADCSAGTASGTVTDLIAFTEVVARP